MGLPAVAVSLDRMARLIAAWHDGEPTVFPALDSTALRGISLYAHVDHAVRMASAVLALAERGLYLEGVPSMRLILECAVTCAWLSVTPGSGDSALLEATRLKRAQVVGIGAATATPFDAELERLKDDADELGEFASLEARKFEERCNSLAGGDWLYVVYRDLSAYSHAGALLLDHYIQEDDGPLGFAYVRDQQEERAASHLGSAVWALHIALSAWDALVPDGDRTRTLADVANDAGFQVVIRRADEV